MARATDKKSFGVSGITLVETVISAALLVVVVVGVVALCAQTMNIAHRMEDEYRTASIAKSRIEDGRSYIELNGFDALTNESYGETDTRLDSNGVPDINGGFYRSTTVTTNFNENQRLTKIEVSASYSILGKKSPHTISISSILVKMT
ncbi:MAG: hypothetical protein PHS37_04900 [Candidatus Omnitrophica bacterium]|nr:hypothetical protein [Candidatus Omnitrophota bacterium]